MRKRLRKKKHVGEFRVFGVMINITLRANRDFDEFLDNIIDNVAEPRGMSFGGGGKALKVHGFLELGRINLVHANLEMIQLWLRAHIDVESFQIGEPVDVWRPTKWPKYQL